MNLHGSLLFLFVNWSFLRCVCSLPIAHYFGVFFFFSLSFSPWGKKRIEDYQTKLTAQENTHSPVGFPCKSYWPRPDVGLGRCRSSDIARPCCIKILLWILLPRATYGLLVNHLSCHCSAIYCGDTDIQDCTRQRYMLSPVCRNCYS